MHGEPRNAQTSSARPPAQHPAYGECGRSDAETCTEPAARAVLSVQVSDLAACGRVEPSVCAVPMLQPMGKGCKMQDTVPRREAREADESNTTALSLGRCWRESPVSPSSMSRLGMQVRGRLFGSLQCGSTMTAVVPRALPSNARGTQRQFLPPLPHTSSQGDQCALGTYVGDLSSELCCVHRSGAGSMIEARWRQQRGCHAPTAVPV